jgi:hypothetical protein
MTRIPGSARFILMAAALCAAGTGLAGEKRSLHIGAVVVASSQCRVGSARIQCKGTAPAPAVTAASPADASAAFAGHLLMRMTPAGASLDSRKAVAQPPDRIVLTIAP